MIFPSEGPGGVLVPFTLVMSLNIAFGSHILNFWGHYLIRETNFLRKNFSKLKVKFLQSCWKLTAKLGCEIFVPPNSPIIELQGTVSPVSRTPT